MNEHPTSHDAEHLERLAIARSIVRDGLHATLTWLNTTGRHVCVTDPADLVDYAKQCDRRIREFDNLPAAERKRLAEQAIAEVAAYLTETDRSVPGASQCTTDGGAS